MSLEDHMSLINLSDKLPSIIQKRTQNLGHIILDLEESSVPPFNSRSMYSFSILVLTNFNSFVLFLNKGGAIMGKVDPTDLKIYLSNWLLLRLVNFIPQFNEIAPSTKQSPLKV